MSTSRQPGGAKAKPTKQATTWQTRAKQPATSPAPPPGNNSATAAEFPSGDQPPQRRKGQRHDWEAIERDYRTGKFTLRELQAKHGAGYADISRRAKREGWTQDLREAVKQATAAALIAEIATERATEAQRTTTNVVLAAAELNKQVILRHRSDVAEARTLALDLLGELRLATHNRDDLQAAVGRLVDSGALDPEDAQGMLGSLMSLVGLHKRVQSVGKIADALTRLQTLERKAYGIDDDYGGDDEKAPTEIPIVFVTPPPRAPE